MRSVQHMLCQDEQVPREPRRWKHKAIFGCCFRCTSRQIDKSFNCLCPFLVESHQLTSWSSTFLLPGKPTPGARWLSVIYTYPSHLLDAYERMK